MFYPGKIAYFHMRIWKRSVLASGPLSIVVSSQADY